MRYSDDNAENGILAAVATGRGRLPWAALGALAILSGGPAWSGQVPVVPPESIVVPGPPAPPPLVTPDVMGPPAPTPPDATSDPAGDAETVEGASVGLPPVIRNFSLEQLDSVQLEQAAHWVEQALGQPHHGSELHQSLESLLTDIESAQGTR
ncbi:hypothetical protein [Ectothiorhodospira sp. BSL-9]|uniref:hypothetical protein n=1 Tax=Ectothiorhodospira sp. BSL-9 TaxID=1442136 RepID=UPI0007B42CBB|nr:hypothetical protein [Ectothiorhodospira sp. BSL-9]ANB03163.1 hypothetical protein ECTOBSL9_2747 [Ectothiorhodospira sp. BSL-9]